MKLSFLYIPAFIVILFGGCSDPDLPIFEEPAGNGAGTAVIITGASARITQSLALLERLDELNRLDNLSFISGSSSGSINAIFLAAILEENNGFDWQDYKDLILNLESEDIFDNDRNDLPLDTRPLYNLMSEQLEGRLNYSTLDDINIPISLAVTQLEILDPISASNIEEISDLDGGIVESLMASASFPVVFPSIRIDNEIYADGGLTEPVPANSAFNFQFLRNQPFDTIYIVSFQRNENVRWSVEVETIGLTGRRSDFLEVALRNVDLNPDGLSQETFIDGLRTIQQNYPESSQRIFVYTPNIDDLPYFPIFDFSSSTLNLSYNLVRDWALDNDPIPLDDFLDMQ